MNGTRAKWSKDNGRWGSLKAIGLSFLIAFLLYMMWG